MLAGAIRPILSTLGQETEDIRKQENAVFCDLAVEGGFSFITELRNVWR